MTHHHLNSVPCHQLHHNLSLSLVDHSNNATTKFVKQSIYNIHGYIGNTIYIKIEISRSATKSNETRN